MQIHELKPHTPRKKKRQIGRGGKRGTTSGRGTKGQKARAGNKLRPEMRDIIKKLPKRRGYGKNRVSGISEKPYTVNVSVIENNFQKNDKVSPVSLIKKGLVSSSGKKKPLIKILGTGEISKAVIVVECTVSDSAREKITKAGGKIENLEITKQTKKVKPNTREAKPNRK